MDHLARFKIQELSFWRRIFIPCLATLVISKYPPFPNQVKIKIFKKIHAGHLNLKLVFRSQGYGLTARPYAL